MLWKNTNFWLLLILALVMSGGAIIFACSTGDDDDDNDSADDDSFGDDDIDDDSNPDDDDTTPTDDDTTPADDDTSPVDDDTSLYIQPPVLSDAGWDPATTILGEFEGYDEPYYYSALFWSVCDLDNDLLGGQVFIYIAGTDQSFIDGELFWVDLNNPPDSDMGNVGDCENPVPTGINILFAPESNPTQMPPGTYCCDIEATDNAGNVSNKLTNFCVTHDPAK